MATADNKTLPPKNPPWELIQSAFNHIRERKTLYIVIDEAHLLDMQALRKSPLLFEHFFHMDVMSSYSNFAGVKTCPKKHNLILFAQRDLQHTLTLNVNQYIKSRITDSNTIKPLYNDDMGRYIIKELEAVKMAANAFTFCWQRKRTHACWPPRPPRRLY